MCGIAGIVTNNKNYQLSYERIDQMRKVLVHRGPDDEGLYLSKEKNVGLGFRRLSILDLTKAGHQPMTNNRGDIWLVFNGEIYNHLAIRKKLEIKGYQYKSKTDTETLLYLYEEKGIDCLKELRGMFAFAIWDTRNKTLFFARDRIGIKPLYYYQNCDSLYFASEIKSIIQNTEIPRKINKQGLYDYLTFMSVPAPNTMFENIYKLPAGHYGIYNEKHGLKITQYWDLHVKTDNSKTEKEWINIIRKEIKESINQRMVCDVPFGAFLSGGIDSSLISVLMQEARGKSVDTFTVGFKNDPEFDESEYARLIRDKYNTIYHDIKIGKKNLIQFLNKMAYLQDEPIGDWVCFPLYHVSKLIRESSVIVAQVGEGSDELFAGYPWYLKYLKIQKYSNYLKIIPKYIKKLFLIVLLKFPIIKSKPLAQELLRRIAEEEFTFYSGASIFGKNEKNKLLTINNYHDSYRIVKKYLHALERHSPHTDILQKMIYLEFKQRLPELLLMRVDKMTMGTSIESRVPFLDHKFVEQMIKIPTKLKTKKNTKYILKRACEGIIPNEIIYRKKQGFGAPIDKWMKDKKIISIFKTIINDKNLKKEKLFNYKYIDFMFDSYNKGFKGYSTKIWLLVNFSLWYKTFITKKNEKYTY